MIVGTETRVFALTGGIGSGKSTVADIWREQGLSIVDADDLARQVVAPGSAVLAEIVAEFGPDVLGADGHLERKKLGSIVFRDAAKRSKLNQLVHPAVQSAATAEFEKLANAGVKLICYVIPLLFETQQQDHFRPVVLVTATPLQQMERIADRDSLPPGEIAARLSAQMPLREKEAGSDIVIMNGGTLEQLKERALRALAEVRAAVEGPSKA